MFDDEIKQEEARDQLEKGGDILGLSSIETVDEGGRPNLSKEQI